MLTIGLIRVTFYYGQYERVVKCGKGSEKWCDWTQLDNHLVNARCILGWENDVWIGGWDERYHKANATHFIVITLVHMS